LNYFPDVQCLKEFLCFPQPNSLWLTELLSEIRTEKPLSIHVRLTDFLNNPEIYDVLSVDYYTQVADTFKALYPNRPLWLFSDDPVLAQEFLGSEFRFQRILGPADGGSSVETLHLLASSFGICAANSTFSWWAGFLGTLNKTCNFVAIPKKFNTLKSDSPIDKLRIDGWYVF
jgi:Glycosyl transferase family 11